MRIGIINYNAGNPVSIVNALRRAGIACFVSSDPEELTAADKLILPGIGCFDAAMAALNTNGITAMLDEHVKNGSKPLLGICLGMQLLATGSGEGACKGLGWVNCTAKRFDSKPDIKVPHVGWNHVNSCKESKLLDGIRNATFYFSHSYYIAAGVEADALYDTEYGVRFISGIEKDNIAGVQFHPEKSATAGLLLLKNFANNF